MSVSWTGGTLAMFGATRSKGPRHRPHPDWMFPGRQRRSLAGGPQLDSPRRRSSTQFASSRPKISFARTVMRPKGPYHSLTAPPNGAPRPVAYLVAAAHRPSVPPNRGAGKSHKKFRGPDGGASGRIPGLRATPQAELCSGPRKTPGTSYLVPVTEDVRWGRGMRGGPGVPWPARCQLKRRGAAGLGIGNPGWLFRCWKTSA